MIRFNLKIYGIAFTLLLLAACGGGGGDGITDPPPANSGLTARYYQGAAVDGNGNITFAGLTQAFEQVDQDIVFWDGTAEYRFEPIAGWEDNYSVEWTGFIYIETAGEYGFGTISDDGSEVWIDGQLVVANNELQWYDWEDNISEGDLPGTSFPALMLSEGFHEITIRFYEIFAFDGIELWWLKPGSGPSAIPYIGTNFADIAPVANPNTNWELVPASVLHTSAQRNP